MIETPRFQQLWDERLRLEIWYSCVFASALVGVGQLAGLEVDRSVLGRPFYALRLPYLFVALLYLIVLLHQRDKLSFQTIQIGIVALALAAFPHTWVSQAAFATSQNPWIPFYGFQIAALAIAGCRLGKGVRLNAFFLAAITIEAAVFWWHFHLGSERLLAQSGYIWNVLLSGFCSATWLVARYVYDRTLRRRIELEARAATAEMTAGVFLSVRDRANSPLQTLEIGLALLKRRQPENAILEALLTALKKLVDLNKIFDAGNGEIDWSEAARLANLEPSKEN